MKKLIVSNPRLAGTLALQIALAAATAATASAQTFVWIEGETPTTANFQGNATGWGNKHFKSGETWLHISIDAGKVKETAPDGVLLTYDFEAPAAGEYEVWARIGYEFVRSPMDWRVGNGEWTRSKPFDLTTDLMEIANWCELAWLQLGKAQLGAGKHTLEIRLPVITNDKNETQRILYALDCFCLSLEPFWPYKHFKPGEDWRTDRDKEAAAHVFKFQDSTGKAQDSSGKNLKLESSLLKLEPFARRALPLNGLWEITRNDEQTPPYDVAQPMMDFPQEFRWTAINVPSNKNTSRPDLVFSHRLWYRTRVEIPEDMVGRGFALRFPQNNLNTTVFVNGEYCGFFAYPYAEFSIDVTKAIKPGVNEIMVGIRDAWYAYATSPNNPMKLRGRFNSPVEFMGQNAGHGGGQGFQDLAWPIWSKAMSGILKTPFLEVMGSPVYTTDVFAKPSVAKKELALEVTVLNTTTQDVNAHVSIEIVNTKSGKAEKKFKPFTVALAAGEEKMTEVVEPWKDPKLWWPDEPNLYWVRTTTTFNFQRSTFNVQVQEQNLKVESSLRAGSVSMTW